MPSRRELPPTPAELLAWLAVPEPPPVSGVFRSEATGGTFAYVSSGQPVVVAVPAGRPVAFLHQPPDRWRLEVDGELLAVSDGTTAVGVAVRRSGAAGAAGEVRHVGSTLQLVSGPDVLLRPGPPAPPYDAAQPHRGPGADRELLAVGDVAADELLGRGCWRWTSPYGTWWLDALTGVLLQVITPYRSARLLELTVEQDVAAAEFAVPADLLARAVPVPDPFQGRDRDLFAVGLDIDPDCTVEGVPAPGAAAPKPASIGDTDFTVCWWPEPADSRLVRGDPDVPEVLLQLDTGGAGTRFWLGVAPAGRAAPALDPEDDDVEVYRWDGDGWTYALSWQDAVSREDLARLVASIPRSWA